MQKTCFFYFKPLYLVFDSIKVSKISSKHFHTNIVQDPIVEKKKEKKKCLNFWLFALKMAIVNGH